jgi:hypothetical protein
MPTLQPAPAHVAAAAADIPSTVRTMPSIASAALASDHLGDHRIAPLGGADDRFELNDPRQPRDRVGDVGVLRPRLPAGECLAAKGSVRPCGELTSAPAQHRARHRRKRGSRASVVIRTFSPRAIIAPFEGGPAREDDNSPTTR